MFRSLFCSPLHVIHFSVQYSAKCALVKLLFFILDLGVFHIGKRTGYFVHWEPIYIGTHADPHYDERLSWEGKSDKMTQVGQSNNLFDSSI